jgi:CopG family transcriptional regulator/antitoxin EndoAI
MAKGKTTAQHRRVNITLPEETVRRLDRAVSRGERSRFINDAVRYFLEERNRRRLRRLLKEGAQNRAARDLALTEEWLPLEAQSWPRRRK